MLNLTYLVELEPGEDDSYNICVIHKPIKQPLVKIHR